ncbi:cyclase family protein [Candidatus Aquiluna sp. UB-MaderosW2red]|uniref:cyclase family protein n=1 Tax=Candidatus Aquiluna sp. UB-MaderosW2red TaxID=1855377 RepID=UPI000875D4C9|nr:cyclase family protein [Candidatus Aquiluna sp. UB-MaderosW2red]SCX05328.1 Kynurenine formamidase [Candidatus Aquiluna sp. UB-MaderosW2red]
MSIVGGRIEVAGLMDLLKLPKQGEVFDLDPGRWPGMPIWAGHPPFQVLTYRSPRGIRVDGDQDWLAPEINSANIGLISEMMIATNHSGSHVDALGHICSGADDEWSGGRASEDLGDFGVLKGDAASIVPFITRGVMVDIPAYLGVPQLEAHYPISLEEFLGAAKAQNVEVRENDVVFVRTGMMAGWPDPERLALTAGAGITRPIAEYCASKKVRAVGADTEGCEVMPSIIEGNPHPVHETLLVKNAIHIMENIYLEELASEHVHEFLFIGLPLKIRGATGSMMRPIAIT